VREALLSRKPLFTINRRSQRVHLSEQRQLIARHWILIVEAAAQHQHPHRVVGGTQLLPRRRRRQCCGWNSSNSGSGAASGFGLAMTRGNSKSKGGGSGRFCGTIGRRSNGSTEEQDGRRFNGNETNFQLVKCSCVILFILDDRCECEVHLRPQEVCL
jgi:hypothetical protein